MESQLNIGRLILKAGDSWGDELSSTRGGDVSGLDLEDSPGPEERTKKEVSDSCHGTVIQNQQNLFPIFLLLP